jgi:hypothetical protein
MNNLIPKVRKMKITVKKRNDGFIAILGDNSGKWEHGNTRAEAIGKLIISYFSEMNIELEIEWNNE